MKAAIIIAYIAIVALAIVIFMQWGMIKKLTPAPDTTPAAGASGKKEVTAGEWTKQLSDNLKKMDVSMTF